MSSGVTQNMAMDAVNSNIEVDKCLRYRRVCNSLTAAEQSWEPLRADTKLQWFEI